MNAQTPAPAPAPAPAAPASGFDLHHLADLRPLRFAEHVLSHLDFGQWLGLGAALGASAAASALLTWAILRLLGAMARRTGSVLDAALVQRAGGPLRVALFAAAFSISRRALDVGPQTMKLLGALESSLFVAAGFWFVLRLLDIVTDDYKKRFVRRGQGQAGAAVATTRKLVKLVALGIAVLMVLDNAGVHVTALLAGLGLGGIAVALAAQKSLENLFGSFTLYFDRPVRVGSFCRFGDRLGQVEEIGLRSTRLRTPERTLVTVPNGEFSSLQLEDFSRRDKIWFHPSLPVRSNTDPDHLRAILAGLRDLLAKHPHVEPGTSRVVVTGFSSYAITVDVSAYVLTGELDFYFKVVEELNFAVLDLLAAHESGIAFSAPAVFE
ncbi:MAG TPA: mechanosensitive ion channel family protein [Myxococcota bacterium]|nr:mechanosensitive ion channel family protein [Myxococcota bacterium]